MVAVFLQTQQISGLSHFNQTSAHSIHYMLVPSLTKMIDKCKIIQRNDVTMNMSLVESPSIEHVIVTISKPHWVTHWQPDFAALKLKFPSNIDQNCHFCSDKKLSWWFNLVILQQKCWFSVSFCNPSLLKSLGVRFLTRENHPEGC